MNRQKLPRPPAHSHSPTRVSVYLVKFASDTVTADRVATLSDDERKRAARIRSLPHRNEFLATRIQLRDLLSAALGCPPAAVPILRKPGGKLHLAGEEMEFSLSHSGGWFAVALSAGQPVGVDVEPIRPLEGMAEIVSKFFPPAARADFTAARLDERSTVFFRWWTRIEAAVKAADGGLDDVPGCLEGAWCESCDVVRGLAVAVAVRGRGPFEVAWNIVDPALSHRKDALPVGYSLAG